jgi:histidine triad (HIT) family protein
MLSAVASRRIDHPLTDGKRALCCVNKPKESAMGDTIFGKIIRREIPADLVYEDEDVIAFRDLNPQAPVHVLFIPRKPLATLDEATAEDAELLGKLLLAAAAYARREGLAEQGYRTVINCNAHGGQTVFHLHVHLLAGRPMHWPPG